eukprot:gene13430-1644_t
MGDAEGSQMAADPNAWLWPLVERAQYNFELYGWYMFAVALVVVVKWHEIEPAFNRWHRKITSPKAVHADKDAVAKARARQQQVTQLAARQAAKERAIKEREAILNQREKKKQATGLHARQDIDYNIGKSSGPYGGGGGSSYRSSGEMRRQGGGGG